MSATLPGANDAAIIVLRGDVHPSAVIDLYRRAGAGLSAGAARVVIDFSGVGRIGSQTMNLLCGALRRLKHRGAALQIVGAPPPLRLALELCGLDDVALHPTVTAAWAAAACQIDADHPCTTRQTQRPMETTPDG